jgi:hypothetical protein
MFPFTREFFMSNSAIGPLAAVLVASSAFVGLPAAAAPPAAPQYPTDAQAAVPALVYRSAFETYRPNTAQAPGHWKSLNDTTARKGGWRAYAREANAPEAAEKAQTQPTDGAMHKHHHATPAPSKP